MAHVVKLRVKDTTASTGTGTKVLARTSTLNFRTFDAVMANGDTCDAIVINRSANQWEHSSWTIAGVGSEPALTRLEFKESSTGAPVHFTEGTKDVLMLYPVAGKLDFTARTLKLAPNIIDGTPGTTSAFRFYDDGNGWIGGIGISSGAVDIRSGWHLNLWSGQTGSQRNTVRVNQNGLGIAVGAAVAAGIDPQAALHVVNRGGAPSAIITTGTNTAVRISPNGASSAIEGVDYTGLNAWRPLFVNGDVVILGAQGYEAMRISANRNVLIGTTVESAKLSIGLDGVADPINYGKAIQITRGPSGGQQIAFIRNGAQIVSLGYMPGSNIFGFGLGTTIDASFWPNYMSFGGGNVGIGVSVPAATLEVAGDVLLTNNKAYKIRTASGAIASLLNIDGLDTTRFYAPGALHINPDSVGATYINYNGSGPVVVGNGVLATRFVVSRGYVGFGTGTPNASLSFGTSTGLNGLYLYDDGNAGAAGFGISPNTLNIFANALSTASAAIAFGKYDKTTFTEWVRIVNGLVGIGIVPTGGRLEIAHAGARGNDAIRLYASGTEKFVFAQFDTTNDIGRIGAYDKAGGGAGKNLYLDVAALGVGHGHSNPLFGVSIKVGNPNTFLAAGTSKGVRIMTTASTSSIEGVDASGVGSFQPLSMMGATLSLGSLSGMKVYINDNGVGIGDWCDAGFNLQIKSSENTKIRHITTGTTDKAAEHYQEVGGKGVYRGVNYNGGYLHEYGYNGLTTRYSDFDYHLFRTGLGADRVIINNNGLGIGKSPFNVLDILAFTVTTGFLPIADFQVPNSAGAATLTRFSIFQLSPNVMALETANQTNTKGILQLQPFGGFATVGPHLVAGDQFSVQADYDGHLNSTIYNHSIGNASAAKFNMTVRDRHVSRMLYYKDQWMQEKGIGVTQFYSEFDTHQWRSNAGVDKMVLHSNKVIWLGNTGGDPVTPTGGGYLYIVGGVLKYKGSSGTVTTLGAA
jgi:hypothetical protein